MPSNITTTNIDVTFPITGVDNDTAGFRNNFGAIALGLDTARTEITELQSINNGVLYQTSSLPLRGYGAIGDKPGMVYITSSTLYVCYDSYQGTGTNIWGKIAMDNSGFINV